MTGLEGEYEYKVSPETLVFVFGGLYQFLRYSGLHQKKDSVEKFKMTVGRLGM